MAGLSWAVKITDFGSAPARKVASSVDKMTDSLTKANKAVKALDRARDSKGRFIKGAGDGTDIVPNATLGKLSLFQRMIQTIGNVGGPSAASAAMALSRSFVSVGSAVDKANGVLGMFGTSVGGVAKTGAIALASAIGAIVVAAAAATAGLAYFASKAVYAFTEFGMSALSFREDAMIAFKTMLGTSEAADKLYARAVDFAAKTPFRTDQIVSAYQKLLVGGFKTDELEKYMNAIGDVAAMKGFDASKIDEMVRGFAKLRGMGKLTGEVMEMESFQGISGKIYEQLGKDMGGKSVDAVRKAMSSGKISSAVAEKAILEVIRTTYSGGKLGGAMVDFSNAWTGIWSTLTSRPRELFEAAGKDMKGGLAKYFTWFKDAGAWLNKALDPKSDSGQRIVALINRIGKSLSDMLGKFDEKSAGKTFDKILTIVERVLPMIESFGAGFKEGLLSGLGPLLESFDSIDGSKATDVEKMGKAFKVVGEALGWVLGSSATATMYLFQLVGWVGGLTSTLYSGVSAVVTWVGSLTEGFFQINAFLLMLPGQMFSAGIDLVLGLADGIRSGTSAAVGAAIEMANAVEGSVRSALDMHSPSKKMKALGLNAGGSFGGGIEESAPRVKSSVYDMVTPPTPRQLPAGGMSSRSSGGGASGGKSVVFNLGSNAIVINGNGDHAEIKAGILEAFEEVALEFGGAH